MKQDYRQRKDFHEYAQEQIISRRISILARLTAGVLVFYLFTFWYFQVAESDYYARLSEENRIRTIRVLPPRGAIFDRNGKVLVRNRMSFGIQIQRDQVSNWDRTFRILARALETSPADVEARYHEAAGDVRSYDPVLVADDVTLGAVAYIEARRADLPGVSIPVERKRFYEGGASGAHLVGYVGEVSPAELESSKHEGAERGDLVGKAGLEKYLDADLRGEPGFQRVVVNNVGRETGEVAGGVPPRSGEDVYSSVDYDLQRTLDLSFGSKVGAAVFLDPWTGEILALTSRPGYDPNLFVKRVDRSMWRALVTDPRHPLQDRAIQSAYSPGSTFKLVVAAAALAEGVITPSTQIFCPGHATFYGRVFNCHLRSGHGQVDLNKAIEKSCNVYFYTVGNELGIDRIAEYARRFGFGQRTGLGLGFEEPGLVPDQAWAQNVRKARWYPSETISVAIGQGPILVTPLQQALMVAAIATDGTRPVPRLRRLRRDSSGAPLDPVERVGKPMSQAVLEKIRLGMWGVVNDNGTGGRAKIPGYDVCGKTGTTQVVGSSAGVKEELLDPKHRDHSWFVGFAPLDKPQIAFAVFVEHGGHGASAAAPIAKDVLEAFFKKRDGKKPVPQSPAELARGLSSTDTRNF